MPPKSSSSSSSRPSTSRNQPPHQPQQQTPNPPQTPPRQPQAQDSVDQNKSTPIVKKTAQDHPCTSGHILRNDRMTAMAEEAEDHILGPMPLETFLDTFLPNERDVVSRARRKKFKNKIEALAEFSTEKDLYVPFIEAVQSLCPNFPGYDTHDKVFKDFNNITIKPDVCFYDKKWAKLGMRGISTVELMAEFKISLNDDAFIDIKGYEPSSKIYDTPDKPGGGGKDKDKGDIVHEPTMLLETDYAHDEDDGQDGESEENEYEDEGQDDSTMEEEDETLAESNPFEADITKLTAQGKDTLGQITSYATAQKSAQFRTHIFSMLVFKQHARLLYWDNAGMVVTERFHMADGLFAEFLGRYNKASAEERGYDPTARLLSKKELGVVRRAGVFASDARLVMFTTMSTSGPDSLYVAEQLTYMGGTSPFGRSTRGFFAYSYSELTRMKGQAKKVFLKDTWRVLDRPEEHTFYATLHGKKVPYIPHVLRWLNVQGQETKMQKLCEEGPGWAQNTPQGLRGFQHYRLMLREIGTPLTEFSSTKELTTIIYQALQAHALAYTDAKILHRDISVGNIMISERDEEGNRTALLVDWDMAKSQDDQSPSAKERTGTWQFAAARLLLDPSQSLVHILQDDLESFVYVLTWVVFRYTPVAFSPDKLYYHMQRIFDANFRVGRNRIGGDEKISYLQSNRVLKESGVEKNNLALFDLLKYTKGLVSIRYADAPDEFEDRFYENLATTEAAVYERRIKLIETSDRMIDIFRSILKEKWPIDDAACENKIQEPPPQIDIKRASDIGKYVATEPATKKRKMSVITE